MRQYYFVDYSTPTYLVNLVQQSTLFLRDGLRLLLEVLGNL